MADDVELNVNLNNETDLIQNPVSESITDDHDDNLINNSQIETSSTNSIHSGNYANLKNDSISSENEKLDVENEEDKIETKQEEQNDGQQEIINNKYIEKRTDEYDESLQNSRFIQNNKKTDNLDESKKSVNLNNNSKMPLRSSSQSSNSIGKILPETPKLSKKYENVKGRIDSKTNHRPGGGNVKIFHEKLKFNVTSKIGSLQNANHVAKGGNVKIETQKLNFKESAKPKIDAKNLIQSPHVEKKIISKKLEWRAESKVGSLVNANHKPLGGDVKIFDQKLKIQPKSKIGSLENTSHKPSGGNVKIQDYRIPTKNRKGMSASVDPSSRRRSTNQNNDSTSKMPGCRDPLSAKKILQN